MATQIEGRTLVKTTTAGWFIDSANPDGNRVRKRDGDTVISLEQWEEIKAGNGKAPSAEQVQARQAQADADNAKTREGAAKAAAQTTKLTSGKVATGATVEIRCAWVDPDNRTAAQKRLFAGPTQNITYDKVVKAAGGDTKAMPSGEVRVIKKQDQFQVRFSPENQAKWRRERRRNKNAERRAAARKAAKAS